jgi:hypothetical protein
MSLVILCASHLKHEQNVEQMIEMLDSQMSQTQVCHVYVSYTGLSLHYDNPMVHLIKQPEDQLSQFQHYKKLVRQLLESGVIHSENYAIFTDDDDIMAPERNAEYLLLICPGLEVALIDKSVVRFSVDCDIQEHAATMQEIGLKDDVFIFNYMNPREYVDLCIRGDLLMNFIDMVDGAKYCCDCEFNVVVYNYLTRHRDTCIEISAKKPLYYYRYSMFRGIRHKYLEELNNMA